jgi:hypothetical protein
MIVLKNCCSCQAAPFYQTQFSKTVAGLVYSQDPNTNNSMILGASPTQSTQFYLTLVNSTQPTSNSTSYDASSSPSVLLINGSSVSDVVQLRIPMLNSLTMSNQDFCATFNVTPPSLMELVPCGLAVDGTSQRQFFTNDDYCH